MTPSVFVIIVLVLSSAACSSNTTRSNTSTPNVRGAAAGPQALRPEYDDKGKLTKLEYDRNGDGKIDTWGYMDGPHVVRVDVDENGDGNVDRWEYHRASPDNPESSTPGAAQPQPAAAANPPDQTVERIERATKFDGRVSRIEYFTGGVLTRIEEDTDGNGQIDKWETYTNGTLATMALDTSGSGKPDRRLVYRADGTFDRIEADPGGSGEFKPIQPSQGPRRP